MERINTREKTKLLDHYDKIYEMEFQKIIEARIEEFDDNDIFYNMITLNGIPKKEFLKCLKPLTNETDIAKYEKMDISNSLLDMFNKLKDRAVDPHIKTELLISLRKLLYLDFTSKDTIKWFAEEKEEVNEAFFVCIYEYNNKCLQQEVAFTLAYLAYKLGSDFSFYAEESINSFLVMLSQWLECYDQHLLLLRRKRNEYNDRKFKAKNSSEKLIYPRLRIPPQNRCHMEVSCCLYAITFILHYSDSPEVIMALLHDTTTRKEMPRYFLTKILHTTLFTINRNSIKNNRKWRSFPKQFYFEVSRLYADSNLLVRQLVREMMEQLHKISLIKLPVMEGRLVEQLENFQMEKRRNSRGESVSSSTNKVQMGRRKTEILPNLAQLLPLLSDKCQDDRSDESSDEMTDKLSFITLK